jgi:hypothetical protein
VIFHRERYSESGWHADPEARPARRHVRSAVSRAELHGSRLLNLITLCTSVTPAFMRLEKATTGSRCRPTTARLVQAGSSWGLKHSSVPT